MINREGEVKIVDFGIAAIQDRYRKGDTGYIIGSPYYISPEQINGEKIDHRIDIYAAGVTLFHLLTGDVPFKGNKVLIDHLTEPIPSIREYRSDVPDSLQEIIEKCMAKDRDERFQNAQEALEHINRIFADYGDEKTIRNEVKAIIAEERHDDTQKQK
jgi:serine/threonine-protein kinase